MKRLKEKVKEFLMMAGAVILMLILVAMIIMAILNDMGFRWVF